MKTPTLAVAIALVFGGISLIGCNNDKPESSGTGTGLSTVSDKNTKSGDSGKSATNSGDTKSGTNSSDTTAASGAPKKKSEMVALGKRIKNSPDEAVKELNTKKQADPSNGTTSYFTAVAYAQKKDWANVLKEVNAGNTSEKVFLDLKSKDINEVIPGFSQLASLGSIVKKEMATIKPEELKALLAAMDTMSLRVAACEPQCLVGFLSGLGMKQQVIKMKGDAAKKAGDKAGEAAAAAEKKSFDKWIEALMPVINENKTAENNVYKKHGFDFKELSKPGAMAKLPPEEKKKLDQVWLDILEVNKKTVADAMKLLPK